MLSLKFNSPKRVIASTLAFRNIGALLVIGIFDWVLDKTGHTKLRN
jgi:hypothetical protein